MSSDKIDPNLPPVLVPTESSLPSVPLIPSQDSQLQPLVGPTGNTSTNTSVPAPGTATSTAPPTTAPATTPTTAPATTTTAFLTALFTTPLIAPDTPLATAPTTAPTTAPATPLATAPTTAPATPLTTAPTTAPATVPATATTTPTPTTTTDTQATSHGSPHGADQYTGFDSVVKEDRKNRKLTFGPDSIKLSKPSNILIDIYGVISSWGFAADLKKFAKENIANYVKENWNSKIVKNVVVRLRDQGHIDRRAGINVPEILPENSNEDEVMNSVAQSVQWQFENRTNTTKAQIDRLCADLWSQSYDNGKLKTHTYTEISDVFNYWRFEEFIKIYSYASGTVEGQRQFLRASSAGDLNRFIANGLNASGGYKFDSNKFKSVVAALREPKPQNLLYITDDPKKAKTAMQAGLRSVVVNRTNVKAGKYDPAETEGITVVNNLSEIEFVSMPGHIPDCC